MKQPDKNVRLQKSKLLHSLFSHACNLDNKAQLACESIHGFWCNLQQDFWVRVLVELVHTMLCSAKFESTSVELLAMWLGAHSHH